MERKRNSNKEQEQFEKVYAKKLIDNKGNKVKSYQQTAQEIKGKAVNYATAAVESVRLSKKSGVQDHVMSLLHKQGLSHDFFFSKLSELANARDKKGEPDYKIQMGALKIGLELTGLLNKKVAESVTLNQTNYTEIDSKRLSSAIEKLSAVNRSLNLMDRESEDAELVQDAGEDQSDS